MSETEFLKLRHELRRAAALMSREQALDLADHLHLVIRTRKAATLKGICSAVGVFGCADSNVDGLVEGRSLTADAVTQGEPG